MESLVSKKRDDTPPAVGPCFLPLKTHNFEKGNEIEERCEIKWQTEPKKPRNIRDRTLTISIELPGSSTLTLRVSPDDTIKDIKEDIEDQKDIPIDECVLMLDNTRLKDSEIISECNIQNDTTLKLVKHTKSSCFLPEAPVTLANGDTKMIKDLKIGDLILTFNIKENIIDSHVVTNVTTHQANCICEIDLGDNKLLCTPNHPLWVPDKGWRAPRPSWDSEVERLKVGDKVLGSNLDLIEVKSIRFGVMERQIEVYSLHIESAHNFFAYGVLVHNMQIFLKNVVGRTYALDVELDDKIMEIKREISKEINVAPEEQCIVFAGKILENERTLAEYNIQKDNMIHLYPYCRFPANNNNDRSITLNILIDQSVYILPSLPIITIRGLRQQISSLTSLSLDDFELLFGGKILLDNESPISEYNISDNSDILVVPTSSGGRCLKFMQVIQDTPIDQFDQSIRSSLSFLDTHSVETNVTNASLKIEPSMTSLQSNGASTDQILAVSLWTSNLFYKSLNEDLRYNNDLSRWNLYLKHFTTGLKYMPYYKGKAYRGFSDRSTLRDYQKGKNITWYTISALSKSKEVAQKRFCKDTGMLFEVEVVSARDITKVSTIPSEEEVILLPHTCFEVIDVINKPGQPAYVKLREIPVPRSPKVLFWVDDNPQNNYSYARELESQGTSCVFCTNTKDALRVIDAYKWLLYFDHSNFKIVTDMVRYEGGVPNYNAGIDLMKQLFGTYKYTFEVLVYCGDHAKVKQNVQKSKVNGPYKVTNKSEELLKFINFS